MSPVLCYLLLAVGATGVIQKGSELLERSAERLSSHSGLPVVVHGAVVIAIGSGFLELSSVVISTLVHGEFGLGIGAIVGSAIFNLFVAIPVGVILDGTATVNFVATIPMMGFLAFATLVFVVLTRAHL